jgi:hypothetical protein
VSSGGRGDRQNCPDSARTAPDPAGFPRGLGLALRPRSEIPFMKWTLTFVVLSIALLSPVTGSAHHAFSAEYDIEKPIALKGTLMKMDWVNPHGWLYVDVKESDGKIVHWEIEAGNPNALLRRGLRTTDFPAGVEVVITGYRAKNGTTRANGRTVKLGDGRDFFLGSSGNGAPQDGAEGSTK